MKKALLAAAAGAAVVLIPLLLFVLNVIVDVLQLIFIAAGVAFFLGVFGYLKFRKKNQEG